MEQLDLGLRRRHLHLVPRLVFSFDKQNLPPRYLVSPLPRALHSARLRPVTRLQRLEYLHLVNPQQLVILTLRSEQTHLVLQVIIVNLANTPSAFGQPVVTNNTNSAFGATTASAFGTPPGTIYII